MATPLYEHLRNKLIGPSCQIAVHYTEIIEFQALTAVKIAVENRGTGSQF